MWGAKGAAPVGASSGAAMASARVAAGGLWVVSVFVLATACGRTPLADGDLIGNDGRGASNAPRAGRSGANPSDGGNRPVPVKPNDPPPVGAGSGGATGGTPAPTAGSSGGTPAPTAGSSGGTAPIPAGSGGVSGRSGRGGNTAGRAGSTAGTIAPPPMNPDEPLDPLNPQRCAVDEPTVLTIDPGGRSGQVTGWLESAPTLMFDDRYLPRFAGGLSRPMSQSDLALWWSIASLDADEEGGEFYFYALSSDTVLAAAHGETDASRLMYSDEVVGPIPVGEVVVWHHLSSDRYVALRVEALYGTDSTRQAECAAIDASWIFAVPGTSKFPHLP
jgi:hypothetical protein